MKNKILLFIFFLLIIVTLTYTIYHFSSKSKQNTNTNFINTADIQTVTLYNSASSTNYDLLSSTDLIVSINNIFTNYNSSLSTLDGSTLLDNNLASILANNDSTNYFIEIQFNQAITLNFSNLTINCTYLIIDINNMTIYYWNPNDTLIKEIGFLSADLSELKQICKNSF